jgi:diguanylate cyclase (GGDEF)-like protein/PAS domain S-box-containing protein
MKLPNDWSNLLPTAGAKRPTVIPLLMLGGTLLACAVTACTTTVAASLIVLLMGGLVVVAVHRIDQTIRGQRRQIDIAVNSISLGLLLLDAQERIVVCNRRYIEMYGLSPDVVKPGCTFGDLMFHRQETGSFAGSAAEYRSALLSDLSQGKTVETTTETPSGRIIRIVNKPLANGGWVATHEDITERERLMQAQVESEELLRKWKLQLDTALNNMMQGLCIFDADGRIVLFNQRYVELMGLAADDLMGLSLLDLFRRRKASGKFTHDPETFFAGVLASVRSGKSKTRIMTSIDGRALRVVDQPMPDGGWVATFEDITEQRKIEQERDRNREFLTQIVDNVPITIIVKDARTRQYVLINREAEEHLGRPRDQVLGKTPDKIWPGAAAEVIAERDRQLMESNEGRLVDELSIDTPGRGPRSIISKRLVIPDGEGQPQYLVAVIEDVTERKQSEERIVYLAHYDPVTELPNRVLFRERLEHSLKRVRDDEGLALLYLDLDHFKSVNDTLGHPVGDELLKAVADRLRSCLHETDIVSRLGGDEFAVVQMAVADPQAVVELANRIQDVIRAPFDVDGHQLVVDTSIGIALAPHDGTDADQLLKNADLAMYESKAEGRGTFHFFEQEIDIRLKARRALEFDLREAIMTDGFELYYQPIVGLRDNKISGCEALLRWHHRERGMISPVEFIPIAEETGLIVPLGEWVLRTACAEAVNWPDDIRIAVNISPVQFKNGDLLRTVVAALAETGLPASRLELEITEAVLLRDDDAALALLHRLQGLGARIAMDDFGTGYSSLSFLQRFPFDKIKIDRSFVAGIAEDESSRDIVQAVVNMARSRSITTTAEGVETEQQMELLRLHGCSEMQGYLFSPPRPAAETMRIVTGRRERSLAVA